MKALALLYHDIIEGRDLDASGFPGEAAARYKLDLADFERHLAAIAATGCFHPGRSSDEDSELHYLTIDDGGVSAVKAAGIIEHYGWRAHFFVTAGYVGRPGFLAPDQIRELDQRGHVIGSHSYSHPERMACCTWDELVDEWKKSADRLSGVLGKPVTSASVPGGYYSRTVARAAAAAGITRLFTSEPIRRVHRVDICEVCGRYTLWRGMPPDMAADLVAGRGLARARQYAVWNAKKIAKVVGGSAYIRFKRWWLDRTASPS